jgi:serine/threonine protein kinase
MDLIGKTVGNFRIDRLLGEGGMGAVFQGYDLSLQREVAIKFIHPHLAHLLDFLKRFIQEARLLARLDHPGIVKVYMLGKEGDMLFLPMEFIKGGNLRQLLDRLIRERKWLPLDEAILLVQQLCQVVEYTHQHGVLHRDIKPANLMLKPEPTDGLPFRVILTDLGLAKLLEGLGITQEGTSVGTPAYMSPEQASGQPTDRRSDVYSLGVLLYELAVGRLPFQIKTITEAARYYTQAPPPAPRSLRPDLPATLEQIILKALEKDPNNRYSSAAELGTALAGLMKQLTEILDQASQGGVSLVTKYEESIIAPMRPASASLMTVLENNPITPRGVSVFEGQSVAPSTQTRIQVIEKDKTAKVLPLPSGTVTIGRDRGNHIVLNDNKASREHARITWDGMEYYVMDMDSTNGTFLQNTRLLPGVAEIWKPGQTLRIGDTWLRLVSPKADVQHDAGSRLGNSLSYTSSSAGVVGVSITPLQLAVEAGGSVTASISLQNQSPEVDHFSLYLTGIPGEWVASLPPTVRLMPGERKEVELRLHIPRDPQSQAGLHQMKLKATSQRDSSQFVEIKLALTIAPFSQFRAELQPQRLRAGRAGRLMVSNQGNTQETFNVQFSDPAEELVFQPAQLQVRAPEGGFAIAEYRVQPRQTRWLGGERSHSFSARVNLPKGQPQTTQGTLVSYGLIPVWIPPAIIMLCLLLGGGLIWLLSRPSRDSRVPTSSIPTSSVPTVTPPVATASQENIPIPSTATDFIATATVPPTLTPDLNTIDTDNDGMPDGWEIQHNLNPKINDATVDPDKDCKTNLTEYQNQTDPQSPDAVQVPANLQGQSIAQAQQQIQSACLQLGQQKDVIDSSIPKGQVVSTDPSGGQMVPPNTAITLLVSMGHACAKKQVVFSSQSLQWFNPINVKGDNEFGGKGPRVNVKVTVEILNEKQVYVNVYMAAQERFNGDSRAQGETGFYKIGDVPVPDTWKITSQTDFYGEITYDDLDHAVDVFPGDNSPLINPPGPNYGPVQKFEIIGDTEGNDIGTNLGVDTGVRVTLKMLEFGITETVNCVNQFTIPILTLVPFPTQILSP